MWQLKVQTWQKCENIPWTKENRRKFPTKFSKIRRIFSQHFSFEPYRAFFSSPGRARAWPVQNFRASSPKKARKNGSGRAEPTGRAGPDPPLLLRCTCFKEEMSFDDTNYTHFFKLYAHRHLSSSADWVMPTLKASVCLQFGYCKSFRDTQCGKIPFWV